MPPPDSSDSTSDAGSSRKTDDGSDITLDDMDHIGRARSSATVLNPTVLVPAHVQQKLADNDYSGQDVLDMFAGLRDELEQYLDPGEELQYVYRGVGADFDGAGRGAYVLGATDRRFVLLDMNDNFGEVNYDAVTEITGERGKVSSFSAQMKTSSSWTLRDLLLIGLPVAGVLGFFLDVFGVLVFIISVFLLIVFVPLLTIGYVWEFYDQNISSSTPTSEIELRPQNKKVIIRTPTSTERDTTVHTNVDHFTETADINVTEETSERYVLRQWLPLEERIKTPEELSEVRELHDGTPVRQTDSSHKYPAVTRYDGDEYDEPDLTVELPKIVREHR